MRRSRLLLLLFLWLLRPAWACAQRSRSSECPVDVDCALGVRCPPGTIAQQGSARCCPGDLRCAPGLVVDGDRCGCVPFGCPEGLALVVVVEGEAWVACERSAPPRACPARAQAVDLRTGVCLAARLPCEEEGGQLWRSGVGRFECVK